jgi:DNA repair protein RadD
MQIEDRWYQKECVEALYADSQAEDIHPVGAVVTAGGKTFIGAMLIEKILDNNPESNILILSHVQEILEQQIESLENFFNGFPIGIYSSGLNSKTITKITVAGIQSVWRYPEKFMRFDYVVIDEAHLISPNQNTMYRKFLKEIGATYIGLTATPYRLGSGVIYEGENALFNRLSYDLTQGEKFTRLQEEGFISFVYSKNTSMKMGGDGIKKVAGDFSIKELSQKYNRENITRAACIETAYYGKKYKKWLIFAIDTKHADNIAEVLNGQGIKTISIHSKMKGDRKQAIEDFENGIYRAAVNVDMLTTGLDIKTIDLISMMRATESTSLYQQIIGRGLRVHESKAHCLVLDFAGNVKRHGAINDVVVRVKGKGKGNGKAITKDCPECDFINHLAAKNCINCNYEFPREEKIKITAATDEIVSTKKAKKIIIDWAEVKTVSYHVHKKIGKPNLLKVVYHCGLVQFNEYINLEGKGYAKHFALNWLRFRWTTTELEFPKTADDVIAMKEYLKTPKRILVDSTNTFPKIVKSEF